MTDEKLTPLSKKNQAFVDEYFICNMNATEAYLRLHPKSSYDAARSSAARLLSNANISSAILNQMKKKHMDADEALARMALFARGDMGELLDTNTMGFNLDMQAAKEKGLTRLIKRVKQKTTTFIAKKESEEDREVTELEVELYPADNAVKTILQVHGKLVNRIEGPGEGGEHIVRVIEIVKKPEEDE